MNNNFHIDLGYLTLGEKYLYTAGRILEKMVNSGNPHMTTSNHGDFEKIGKEYDEKTKWSDFEVLVPALFLFCHVLELIMKGLVSINEPDNIHGLTSHETKVIFNGIKKKYSSLGIPIGVLEDYIFKYIYIDNDEFPEKLKEFTGDNNIKNFKELYFSLRYPTANKEPRVLYNYISLKYQEEKIMSFAQELIGDIDTLCREAVKIYRSLEKTSTVS